MSENKPQNMPNVEEFIKFHGLLTTYLPGYRPFYFPLMIGGKDPVEGISWKKNGVSFGEAKYLMRKGHNIGIAATDADKLCIVDVDDLNQVDINQLKPTLRIKSRKQIGLHNYYFTDDPITEKASESAKQNLATEDAGEVRAKWQYVVAPGSYVQCSDEEIARMPDEDKPFAGYYRVLGENPVANITFSELPEIYRNVAYEKIEKEAADRFKAQKTFVPATENDKNKSALWSLTIHDVTGLNNDPARRFEMLPEFHGSETGKNASVSNDLLHCWRHGVSHNAFSYLAVASGFSSCSKAGSPHGGSTSGIDMSDPETCFKIWKYAKERGFIPENDPIPAKALVYIALESKLCSKADVKDGWKLSSDMFKKALEKCREEGINPGERKASSKKSQAKASSDVDAEPEKIRVFFDEVADMILNRYNIFTMDDTKEIYIYIDGVYKTEGADTLIKAEAKKFFTDLYIMKYMATGKELPPHIPTAGIQTCNEVLDHIRVLTAVKRKDIDENEEYKWLLNLKNGILNFKTKEFIPHSPEYRITRRLPITYDEKATCPNIVKFLSDTLDPADVEVILEFIGYCLIPDTRFPQSIILQGEGSNGKSVLMALIKQFFGEENLSAIEMQQLCDDRFAAAQLYGKLVNVYPDMSGREITDTGKYKAVSAGDMIEAQRKYGQPFKFRNYSRQIYSVNTVPYTRDQTFSFFRRMILILFPWTFVSDPDPEKNEKKADTDIQTKITTEQELSGLLNLAISCGKHLFEQGKYSYASSVEEVAESYMLKADPVGAFVTVYTEVSDIPMSKTELYEAYVRWSKFKKVPVIGEVKFSKRVKKMGIEDIRPWATEGEARPRLWDGIKLTDTFDKDIPAKPEKYQKSLNEYPVKIDMKNKSFWQQIVQAQA